MWTGLKSQCRERISRLSWKRSFSETCLCGTASPGHRLNGSSTETTAYTVKSSHQLTFTHTHTQIRQALAFHATFSRSFRRRRSLSAVYDSSKLCVRYGNFLPNLYLTRGYTRTRNDDIVLRQVKRSFVIHGDAVNINFLLTLYSIMVKYFERTIRIITESVPVQLYIYVYVHLYSP